MENSKNPIPPSFLHINQKSVGIGNVPYSADCNFQTFNPNKSQRKISIEDYIYRRLMYECNFTESIDKNSKKRQRERDIDDLETKLGFRWIYDENLMLYVKVKV